MLTCRLLGSLLGGITLEGAGGVTVVGCTAVEGAVVTVFAAPVTGAVLSLWLSL